MATELRRDFARPSSGRALWWRPQLCRKADYRRRVV